LIRILFHTRTSKNITYFDVFLPFSTHNKIANPKSIHYRIRGGHKIRQQAFPISGVRLFPYKLSDMGEHSPKYLYIPQNKKGNVRPEQTECTGTVQTQDMEKPAVLFCDRPVRPLFSHNSQIFILYSLSQRKNQSLSNIIKITSNCQCIAKKISHTILVTTVTACHALLSNRKLKSRQNNHG
jgi:hypothetical protein